MIGRLRRALAGQHTPRPPAGNVIPFPFKKERSSRESVLAAIVMVSCALWTLGEPATIAELKRLMVDLEPALDEGEIAAVLDGRAEALLDATFPFPLFQRVAAGDFEAWVFTREYRSVMHGAGLAQILRAAV